MFRSIAITLGLCLATVTAQANLLGRLPLTPGGTDYQAVYDTDFNITWLADADLAASNSFGVPICAIGATFDGCMYEGYMHYDTALAWIAKMNEANYLGYSDWRLPANVQPDPTCSDNLIPGQSSGWGCVNSEMGHLFYNELGGHANQPVWGLHNNNVNLFAPNLWMGNVTVYSVWATTSYVNAPASDFTFNGGSTGFQSGAGTNFESVIGAWGVRSGDIVPIPPAAFLFPSALGLLGWARRKAVCGGTGSVSRSLAWKRIRTRSTNVK